MSALPFVIIPYEPKYARQTVAMWRISKEEAIGQPDQHSVEDHLNYLETVLTVENTVFLALNWAKDTVVGLMAIRDEELNQLYIHPQYQRLGIGSQLLAIAKEKSPGTLQLYTFEVNRKAQRFYEKQGFKIIGRGFENEENLPDIKYEWVKYE